MGHTIIPITTNETASNGSSPSRLSSYLGSILNKKVQGVALGWIETIVDWFLTTFSFFNPTYITFYSRKVDKFVDRTAFLEKFPDKGKRLHHFEDGVGVLDGTVGKIVSLQRPWSWHLSANQSQTEYTKIALNSHSIIFNPVKGKNTHSFGKKQNTDYITIQNAINDPKKIEIVEYKITGETARWTIDTTQEYTERSASYGCAGVTLGNTPAYVPEQVITQIDPNSDYLKLKTSKALLRLW